MPSSKALPLESERLPEDVAGLVGVPTVRESIVLMVFLRDVAGLRPREALRRASEPRFRRPCWIEVPTLVFPHRSTIFFRSEGPRGPDGRPNRAR
jgi:hypothetical protein